MITTTRENKSTRRVLRLRNVLSLILIIYLCVYVKIFTKTKDDHENHQWIGELQTGQEGHNLTIRETGNPGRGGEPSSLDILLDAVTKINRRIPDSNIHNETDDIDPIMAMDLCNNFLCGAVKCLSYKNSANRRRRKRRIFAGGLIADDSWHTIGANALETFGIFHTVVFVESNRTQNYEPRPFRFTPNSKDYKLLTGGIFGPNTKVHVHQFIHEQKERAMIREHSMRQVVLEQWKELGMTRDDIGLIMDVDEIPTRRALRALQICDVGDESDNKWDSSPTQDCSSPLVRFSVPFIEGSPKCIIEGDKRGDKSDDKSPKFARFLNPSAVIGACIDGIGDSNRHINPPRVKDSLGNPVAGRMKGYGERLDYSEITKMKTDKYFPLYNGADFRKMKGDKFFYGGVGFHLHNFFDSIQTLRFKYRFYGHVHDKAFEIPLGALNSDLNVLVKCVHNISDDGNRKKRLKDGLKVLEDMFALPAAFQLPGYVDKRHEEIKALVEEDEREYGRADLFNGQHLYREHMLTHPGRRNIGNNSLVTT